MNPIVLLGSVFFLSGAAGLVYQVVWGRLLVLVFGSTTIAVSTVLAVFMGGLALGGFAGGRMVDRMRRPLVVYAAIEVGIAVYAVAIPWLLTAVVPIYQALWQHVAASSLLIMGARVVLVVAVLAIPTVLMGATLPVISRAVSTGTPALVGRVAALYTANTAGAIAGAAGTGFVLLPSIGVTPTIYVAAAANVVAAIAAAVLARGVGVADESVARGPRETAAMQVPIDPALQRRVLLTLAISGAAALINEVVWSRALSLVLGSSVYAFSAMLATFLSGLAAGAACGTWLVRKIPARQAILGGIQLGVAISSLVTLALLGQLPLALIAAVRSLRELGPDAIAVVQFALSFLVMFVPTFGFGLIFPVALHLVVRDPNAVGAVVGRLYAVNTAGAIVGAILAGFVLVPTIGIRASLLVALAGCLALGVWLVVGDRSISRRLALGSSVGTCAFVVALGAILPPWSATLMSSGVYWNLPRFLAVAEHEGVDGLKARLRHGETVYEREGLTATVVVTHTPEEGRLLTINGRTESGDPFMRTQVAIGHWPLWFAPSLDRVLVIGLGSGATTGSVLRYPVAGVDVVELERAVIEASRTFEPENGRPLSDPRVRVWSEDGRNFLLLSRDRYDVIVSQPSLPWVAGAATLFTQEFFTIAASRLQPGGIFGQWVTADAMGHEELRAVLAAFQRAFPYFLVVEPTPGDLFLVGSRSPLNLDPSRVRAAFADPELASDLQRVDFQSPRDLFATLVGHNGTIASLLDGAIPNRDENLAVEFSGPVAFAQILQGRRTDPVAWLRGGSGGP